MKKIISVILLTLTLSNLLSQSKQYDIQFMPAIENNSEDNVGQYFKNSLFNKVNQEITKTGCGAVDISRFLILIRPSITDKNTNGQIVLYKFDLLFSVVDLLTKKTYNNFSIEVAGSGKTPGQAAIDASNRIDIKKSVLAENIKLAAQQITAYYNKNCNAILAKSKTLANTNHFDEAIANLYSIPDINDLTCASEINNTTEKIYQQSINQKCRAALNEAKKEWNINSNANGAQSVSELLSNLTISPDCEIAFNQLLNEIKSKITKDEYDALVFRNKVYDDAVSLEKQRITSIKEIAIEYYKSLIPPTYNYNNYEITNNIKKTVN